MTSAANGGTEKYKNLPEEQAVAAYIATCGGGDFGEVLAGDDRLGVFFHLSPMRESLLNWYPFGPGASLLELRGGMGALTGMLCSRCARVVSAEPDGFKAAALKLRCKGYQNLTVVDGGGRESGDSFDYIVALDPENLSAEYFKELRGRLAPGGRLLLAVENRFGIRYWCGKRNRRTGVPFDGVDGGGVGRAQIALNLERAGFEAQKWYYPMSDHWFAEDIFSENHLPKSFSLARFRPYSEPDSTLVMNEQRLYGDIIQNRVFEFFCNAYLVEARCRAADAPCPIDYAAVTTYRTPEKRFATVLYDDGSAGKIPLAPEGAASLVDLVNNHLVLAGRGVDVLPLSIEGGAVRMPRVRHETLIDYWQRTVREGSLDFGRFSDMFDRIRDIIMRSAETFPPGSFGCDPALGAVQKTAFPELVPANCFYDGENDRLIFFDQEFTVENCPVKFVLMRLALSINYSSLCEAPGMADFFLRLRALFGLDECWEQLCKWERAFIGGVFNHGQLAPIRRMRQIDDGLIAANRRRLSGDIKGEKVDGILKG